MAPAAAESTAVQDRAPRPVGSALVAELRSTYSLGLYQLRTRQIDPRSFGPADRRRPEWSKSELYVIDACGGIARRRSDARPDAANPPRGSVSAQRSSGSARGAGIRSDGGQGWAETGRRSWREAASPSILPLRRDHSRPTPVPHGDPAFRLPPEDPGGRSIFSALQRQFWAEAGTGRGSARINRLAVHRNRLFYVGHSVAIPMWNSSPVALQCLTHPQVSRPWHSICTRVPAGKAR